MIKIPNARAACLFYLASAGLSVCSAVTARQSFGETDEAVNPDLIDQGFDEVIEQEDVVVVEGNKPKQQAHQAEIIPQQRNPFNKSGPAVVKPVTVAEPVAQPVAQPAK